MRRPLHHRATALLATALLAGCAAQPRVPAYLSSGTADHLPPVLIGFLHGFLAPITVVLSMIGDVRIYAWPNGGWPYDLGFVVGFLVFVAAISALARR